MRIAFLKLSQMRKNVNTACKLAAEKPLAPDVLLLNKRMWRDPEPVLGPQSPLTAMARHTYANTAGNGVMLAQDE